MAPEPFESRIDKQAIGGEAREAVVLRCGV